MEGRGFILAILAKQVYPTSLRWVGGGGGGGGGELGHMGKIFLQTNDTGVTVMHLNFFLKNACFRSSVTLTTAEVRWSGASVWNT